MRLHVRRAVTWLLSLIMGSLVLINLLIVIGDPDSQARKAYMALPVAPGKKEARNSRLIPWFASLQFLPNGSKKLDLDVEDFSLLNDQALRRRFKKSGNNTYLSDPRSVWPGLLKGTGDRILTQLRYVPPAASSRDAGEAFKTILDINGLGLDIPPGQAKFLEDGCPVNTCQVTDGIEWAEKADAVLFHSDPWEISWIRPSYQVWILYLLESPMHTPPLDGFKDQVNWTATYRSDSTLVTPYEKFVLFPNLTSLPERPNRNYAAGKLFKVAWFVSNCGARNARSEYVEQLNRYIQVDVYGSCGNMTCSRSSQDKCYDMLRRDYKFYLSFENSNCHHYITEKLYWNALWNDVIPVVMGARKEDYIQVAPPGSFIHVEDFRSAKDLAKYLNKLDQNDNLYNEYFRWKGTGEFVNTKFWCRLCALLHDDHVTWYNSVEHWWRGNGTCTVDKWDRTEDLVTDWEDIVEPALGTYD